MLHFAKKLFLLLAGLATDIYSQKLASEQEIIKIMADMATEIYAMESCLLRALKAWENNPASAGLKIDLTMAYIYEKWPLLEMWGNEAMCHMLPDEMLYPKIYMVKRMARYSPIDIWRRTQRCHVKYFFPQPAGLTGK